MTATPAGVELAPSADAVLRRAREPRIGYWRRWADSRVADMLAAAAAVLLVAGPLLFTDSGFVLDFTNHLWLVWVAGKALSQTGHPSYFLNATPLGVFYPWFAFYGGTLYTITGALSQLLGGHPIPAYVAVTTLAIAGAYGGMLWLGRQLGLERWLSHAPALVVVTSAYYVSNLYGRGAWTEFMATSAIPLMAASALHLTRTRPWRPWPVVAFLSSTIVFTGSHNVTLLLGTTVGAVTLAILWIALGAPTGLPFRRLAMVAGLGLASLLVSAWYLVPDLSYATFVKAHLETGLGEGGYAVYKTFLQPILSFDAPAVLFDPLRTTPAAGGVPGLFVQVPDWFLVWALAAGALLLGRGARPEESAALSRRLRRVWVGVAALIAILLLMLTSASFWKSIPSPYNLIQFPFRLNSYVFYTVAALVLVSALAMQRALGEPRLRRRARSLRGGLVVVCAISVGLCVWQTWVPNTLYSNSYRRRGEALASASTAPRSWYDEGSYNDLQAPVVAAKGELIIPPSYVHGDRFAAWVNLPPGRAPIQTDIAGGAYLVHISGGLTRIGRNQAGFAVVRRSRPAGNPVHVVIETTHSATIALGWVISVLACVTLAGVIAFTAVRSRRS
ncbi:MAG TPA: hypothetical protein VMB51_01985 [Solirubrobacteraceae bacterium]|nr:hypothetical protein [Solirubrobacteraceae bacterium]